MISECEKCSYPNCDCDGTTEFLNTGKCLCVHHKQDWQFIRNNIATQALVVSALMAARAERCTFTGIERSAVDVLENMQRRRMLYLKLAGFNCEED
jgi:hypothetical protein